MASGSIRLFVDGSKGFRNADDCDIDSDCDQGGATAPSRCSFLPEGSCVRFGMQALTSRDGSGLATDVLLVTLVCVGC